MKIILTTHFKARAKERFESDNPYNLAYNILNDYFEVTDYHKYSKTKLPNTIALCSRDFKKLIIAEKSASKLVLVTIFNPMLEGCTNLLDWFQSHYDKVQYKTLQNAIYA